MKRLLVAVLVIALLFATVLVFFFSASKYRVEDQRYFLSLYDFLFMVHSYNRQGLALDPPELTERRYERVMAHARRTAHHEVLERVVWSLTEWGDAVVPRLVQELDVPGRQGRVVVAAQALGKLRATSAAPALTRAMARAQESDRWLLNRLIDAAGEMGPEMASPLIDLYRSYETRDEPVPYSLLDAIGKAGGGAEFLIAEMDKAASDEEILALLWPLAFTQDERAARVLLSQLHHPSFKVRRRARDAPAQSMGIAVVEPAVDFLEAETDDILRNWVLNRILARPTTAGSGRAIELLARLLEDPVVGWQARYALARSGSERGIEILLERADRYPPAWLLEHVDDLGARGLPLVELCLEHENVGVRRSALDVLEDMRSAATLPLLEKAAADVDEMIRHRARERLEQADLYLLEESFRQWISEMRGRPVGRVRPPDREGVRVALGALSFVHWVGLAISVLVGLLLLAGWLRAFESFKLALVLQFLLVEGIVGDFFFFSSPSVYRWATAGRMVLLLGLLFLRDEPLPGETRGRVERIAVRSLWIVVPLLLLVGTSLFAESLRLALRDFEYMKWALVLIGVTTLLVVEQAFVPWDFFPRGGRLERALTLALSTSIVLLFAVPLARLAMRRGIDDRGALAGLLLAPLVVALVFHVRQSRLFAPRRRASRPRARAPGRLRVVDHGDSLLIKLRRRRRFRGLPLAIFCLAFLVISWVLIYWLDAAGGGGPAMFLVMILAVIGTALGALVFSGLSSGFTVEVRAGALRWANTFLGGALGSSSWYRRLRLPALHGGVGLTEAERRWIAGLLVVPLLLVVSSSAHSAPEGSLDPSDYVRVLESEMPGPWTDAIEALLGEEDELAFGAVSSVLRRVSWVDPAVKRRVAVALGKASGHPLALSQLRDWARSGEEPLRSEAMAALLKHRGIGALEVFGNLLEEDVPERLEVLRALVATLERWEKLRHDPRRDVLLDPVMEPSKGSPAEIFERRYRAAARTLLESEDPDEREEARTLVRSLETPNRPATEPEEVTETLPARAPWVLASLAWLPALAGAILFVWGFNLTALAVRIRFRPVAKAKSVALGPVALEGVVQPRDALLRHPVTGERCVYYAGADRDHPGVRFYLADDTGRVLVQPDRAVLLSDDGVLISGERVHVVGLATRDAGGNVVIRKDGARRPFYQRFTHGLIEALFGFGHHTALTRMLFSDPHRCFWIWDDLDQHPLSQGGDVLWLALGVSLAGAWMIVFALAAAGVIDAGLALSTG